MSYLKVFVSISCFVTLCHGLNLNPVIRPEVITFNTNGSITGTILTGYRTPFIEAFLGVPFAEPPVGDLRFSDPVPFQNFWSHDHIANQEGSDCIQKNDLGDGSISGSEDCLYLNVYRPIGTSSDKLLPVIIKIHGGAFIMGSSSMLGYGPRYLMDHGEVILVAVNYRLGPIGFLSTGDSEIPGNFALKDQALAMKWVKENIIVFNGDPDQITIFGQSAGGASVHLHMFSPLSRDLFNRAIVASGSAIAPFVYVNDDPLSLVRTLAGALKIDNFDTLSTSELAAAFRATDPRDILEAVDVFRFWDVDPLVVFKSVVESVDNRNAFLTEDPRVSIENGNYKTAPIFMTIVPEEGVVRTASVLLNPTKLASLNDNFDLVIGLQNDFPQDDPNLQSHIDQIVDFYFNGTRYIGMHNANRYTNMFSDRTFIYPYYASYKFHSKTADPTVNPLYLSEFNYRGPNSLSQLFPNPYIDFGVIHGDELSYLFDSARFPMFDFDSVDAQLVMEMVDIYVNFASGRVPHEKSTVCTFDESDPDKPCEYLYIINTNDDAGYKIQSSSDFNLDMVNFWRGIDKLF